MSEEIASRFEVRWADLDVNWHMKNTAWIELGVSARVAFLASKGFSAESFQQLKMGPVMFRDEVRYLREARLGDVLTYTVELAGLSPAACHWEMAHEVRHEDSSVAARLRVEGAWMDLARRKLRRPPDELAEIMRGLRRTEDFRELKPVAR